MENKINNTFVKDTTDYIDSVVNILNIQLKEEGTLREYRRMVYRNGKELQSVNYILTFLVDTGKIFKETVGFEIYTDEEIDFIKITEQFVNETKLFSKNDFIKASEFVINNVIKKRAKKDSFMKINFK